MAGAFNTEVWCAVSDASYWREMLCVGQINMPYEKPPAR
jgi:hypothetical protein